METRRLWVYWITQVVSWSVYMGLLGLPAWMETGINPGSAWMTVAMVGIGIATSHGLRSCFKEWRWLDMRLDRLLLRMVLGALVLGVVAGLLQSALHDAMFPSAEPMLGGPGRRMAEVVLSWVLQLFIWAIVYVAYHYVVRSRLEELRSLRLESANRENQLSNLRSQLNPHFMFNALNSIRALIEEDPERAKRSITLLSTILRNAMNTVKRRTVPLGEEIDMVRSYLALEAMRYEERLRVSFEVDPALERRPVPPMMLQTLVENAVRHGIAKRTEGGEVRVTARPTPDGMVLEVRNSGHYTAKEQGGGIGLRNTEERLAHIYGAKAALRIYNDGDMVACEIRLPLPEENTKPLPNETPVA
jgi:signal transduction histidine kinase